MSELPQLGLLDLFVNSGLRGVQWPKVTCALLPPAVFGTDVVEWSDGGGGAHAEEKLIPRIWRLVENNATAGCYQAGQTVVITILQNYSPCHRCSERYRELYSGLKDMCGRYGCRVHMEIAFTALYYINRPSDLSSGRYADEHGENVNGMNRLLQDGVEVRPFADGDWWALVFAVHWDILRVRREEDFRLRADFKSILTD